MIALVRCVGASRPGGRHARRLPAAACFANACFCVPTSCARECTLRTSSRLGRQQSKLASAEQRLCQTIAPGGVCILALCPLFVWRALIFRFFFAVLGGRVETRARIGIGAFFTRFGGTFSAVIPRNGRTGLSFCSARMRNKHRLVFRLLGHNNCAAVFVHRVCRGRSGLPLRRRLLLHLLFYTLFQFAGARCTNKSKHGGCVSGDTCFFTW